MAGGDLQNRPDREPGEADPRPGGDGPRADPAGGASPRPDHLHHAPEHDFPHHDQPHGGAEALPLEPPALERRRDIALLTKQLLLLASPMVFEHVLHIAVGVTDTWLANNLLPTAHLGGEELARATQTNTAAGAAIGSVTYLLWFLGLMTGAVGTGSTALIARATGARDRRTANSAVGQSILLALSFGTVLAIGFYTMAEPIARAFRLADEEATQFMIQYLRILSFGVPLAMCTFIANACLRGAGDTITPALAMVVLDIVNIGLSFSLCYGWGPLPALGFAGIAWGTTIAYGGGSLVVLGALGFGVGRSRLRLHLHRLKPAPGTIRRILRVGIPSGGEGVIHWGANFVVVALVNALGNVPAAAHNITIRIESLSYMTGFAFATAAATMVGQSLGMKDPVRARRSGYVAFICGGTLMVAAGLLFIAIPHTLAGLFNRDPVVVDQTAPALFVTGFAQIGFAAMMIFGGSLRGAGDTTSVMLLNLSSSLVVRMLGCVLAVNWLGFGLTAVWIVLSVDLCIRGVLLWRRFHGGRWMHIRV